ncbi:hypothetical protein FBUS_01563 [Fasciolopsis buskii]|uniref:Uncharacterized protein n=1 Tax=Fasciolopsis buskii TaxID=27845 RepID=A0A8E0RXW3_9TREM|nr:hypothetical protein FBUS_01563 [Fasciolopsis buski]
MTDVCVQARRVANNQRSRQHPVRLGNYTSTNTSNSAAPSPEPSTESSGIIGGSLLNLKDRNGTGVTGPETTTELSNSIGIDAKPLYSSHRLTPNPVERNKWTNKSLRNESRMGGFSSPDWMNEKRNACSTPIDDASSCHFDVYRRADQDPESDPKDSPPLLHQAMGADLDTKEGSS